MSEESKQSAPFDTQPAGLEKAIHDFLTKTLNFKPASGSNWLADNAWWLVIIGGILALLSAWNYWNLAHYTNSLLDLARASGVAVEPSLGVMWYLALIVLVVEGLVLLVAAGKLKAKQKSGWNLLYYLSLLSVVLGVIFVFVPSYGVGGLLGMVVGTFISWLVLFYIRPAFIH